MELLNEFYKKKKEFYATSNKAKSPFEKIVNDIKQNYNEKAYEEKKKQWEDLERIQRENQFKELLESCGISFEMYKKLKTFKFLKFKYKNKKGEVVSSEKQYKQVVKWWESGHKQKPFLILYGEKGTGKTKVAQKLAISGIKKYKQVYYTDRKKLDLKFYNLNEVEELIEYLQEVKLLIIDDFFTGYHTDYKFEMLYTIIDHRYIEDKLTIITMNEDIKELRNRELTKGAEKDLILLADRLFEKGYFVYFDYPSLRDNKFLEYAKKGDITPLQKGYKIEDASFDI